MTEVVMPEECQSHAHHGSQRLEPVRIAEAGQESRPAVMVQYALGDRRPKRDHARCEPRRHAAAVQWEIGDA
jgi:hypothetical protein